MRILITGNMGYVGSCVVPHLRNIYPQACLVGLDIGYFAGCLLDPLLIPERDVNQQHFGDIRRLHPDAFTDVDAVVHLAALSNDPIGSRFEAVTAEVNHEASLEIARRAKLAGVRSFVYASSCSVYGCAEEASRTEISDVNPLTAYAKSKILSEQGLRHLATRDFIVTCLRFATACGMSPRLRLDLVLNDFVAGAAINGEVRVLSNGSPWRPLIHVKDMARAIEWSIQRSADEGGPFLVMNTGSEQWTYQIRELAEAVAASVPEADLSINRDAPNDKRSYKVDFSLFRQLAPQHQPEEHLNSTISELKLALKTRFREDSSFPTSQFIRLSVLSGLLERGFLNSDLTWSGPFGGHSVNGSLPVPASEGVLR